MQRVYTSAEADIVASWVAGDHGLVVLDGFTATSSPVAAISAAYGIAYDSEYLQGTAPVYVTGLSFPPLTLDVSSLLLEGGFGMTATDPTATVFAIYSAHDIGMALTHGSGRVVLHGDDWILSDQELNRKDSSGASPTATFWNNVLLWDLEPGAVTRSRRAQAASWSVASAKVIPGPLSPAVWPCVARPSDSLTEPHRS